MLDSRVAHRYDRRRTVNDEDLLAISASMHEPALRTIRLEVDGVPFLLQADREPRAVVYHFLAQMYGNLAWDAPDHVLIDGVRWNIAKKMSGFYLYT